MREEHGAEEPPRSHRTPLTPGHAPTLTQCVEGDMSSRGAGLPVAFVSQVVSAIAIELDALHAQRCVHGDVRASRIAVPRAGSAYLLAAERASEATADGDVTALVTAAYYALNGTPPAQVIPPSLTKGASPLPQAPFPFLLGLHSSRSPAGLLGVFANGLSPKPGERYATAGAFAEALRAVASAPMPMPAPMPAREDAIRVGPADPLRVGAGDALRVGPVLALASDRAAAPLGPPPTAAPDFVAPRTGRNVFASALPLAICALMALCGSGLVAVGRWMGHQEAQTSSPAGAFPASAAVLPSTSTRTATLWAPRPAPPPRQSLRPMTIWVTPWMPAQSHVAVTPGPSLAAATLDPPPTRVARRHRPPQSASALGPLLPEERLRPASVTDWASQAHTRRGLSPTPLQADAPIESRLAALSSQEPPGGGCYLRVYARQAVSAEDAVAHRVRPVRPERVLVDDQPSASLTAGRWTPLSPGRHRVAFYPAQGGPFEANVNFWVRLDPRRRQSFQIPLPRIPDGARSVAPNNRPLRPALPAPETRPERQSVT